VEKGAWRSFAVMVALLVAPSGGVAQQGIFEDGSRRYQAADYEGALESYLSIRDAGYESGELYYNIGNTYFKLGDLGRSIVNYERALELMPRDNDVRANLELARSLTADDITPLPGFWLFRTIDWWVHALPRTWLLLVVATAYLVGSAGFVAHVLGRGQWIDRWGRRLAIAGGVLVGLLGINLAAVELEIGEPVEAVVLSDEVHVQSAPSEDRSLQVFVIHEGTKVRIDQQSGEWAEIVLADGKVGWVKVDHLETI
jgi:tetratricopeptide (TPR) repeat protein